MRILTLIEAAALLKMTQEGLRRKVIKGEVPGAKIGKRWCFLEDDLAEYLRSLYPTPAKSLQGVTQTNRRATWHFAKEKIFGGLELDTTESVYKKALGLPTS